MLPAMIEEGPDQPAADRLRIHIEYCDKDRAWQKQLRKCLVPHKASMRVRDRSDLSGGDPLDREAEERAAADVRLLLVSADFLASREGEQSLDARPGPGQRVTWVPVRPSAWCTTWLADVAPAYQGGKALSDLRGPDRDSAMVQVAAELAGLRRRLDAETDDIENRKKERGIGRANGVRKCHVLSSPVRS